MEYTISCEGSDYQIEIDYVEEAVLKAFSKRYNIDLESVKKIYGDEWLDFNYLVEEFKEDIVKYFKEYFL